MPPQPPSTREQLDRLLVVLRRSLVFWKRGLAVFLVCALGAVPFVLMLPRSYRSETIVLYQETIRSSDVTGDDGSSDGARRVGARLRELLLSRTSLEPIINDLNLYPNSIIRGELIGAVEDMRKNIMFRARDGDTYEISFTGDTPKQAQEVTRRLGECVLQETATRRSQQARTLKEFLATETVRNEVELKQKEAELTRFVVLHPEYASRLQGLPAEAKTPSTGPGAAALGDPVLASLDARAARIERQLDPKTAPPTPAPKPTATFQRPPDSPELVAARRDLADKLSQYTDKHPDVITARNRLRAAERAQNTINEAAAAAFAAQVQQTDEPGPPETVADEAALRKELASLQAQIAARRLTVSGSPAGSADARRTSPAPAPPGTIEFELDFRRLQREVSDGRDRQQKLDERLFRASIAESSVMDDRNIQVTILDPAYLPVRPVSKPRSIILAGLLAIGLVLGLATAFVSANLDDRIYDRGDIERLDIIPVVAIIPRPVPAPIRPLPPRSDPLANRR